MRELYYVYLTIMSPENQGVFQLLKEVTFQRINVCFQTDQIHAVLRLLLELL
jgi:hypothetical protein